MTYNIFNLFSISNNYLTLEDKINLKRQNLGFTDDIEVQKLTFAFIFDKYKPASSEKKEFETLKNLEWFAGSLTAKRFSIKLDEFLQKGDTSKILNQPTLRALVDFSQMVKESLKDAYLIDLARSSHFGLILGALLGSELILRMSSASKDEVVIEELTDKTIERLSSLTQGQSAIFLVGNLIHETYIRITHFGEYYEFCHYDANNDKTFETTPIAQENLINKNLWKSIYTKKFDVLPVHFKMDEEVKKEIEKTGVMNFLSTSEQKSNSCHYRSLHAVLKDYFMRHCPYSIENKMVEWNTFKYFFTRFLLQDDKLRSYKNFNTLLHFGENVRIKRLGQLTIKTKLIQAMHAQTVQSTIKSYLKAIYSLNPFDRYDIPFKDNAFKSGIYLHKILLELMNTHGLHPKTYRSMFSYLSDPCLEETINIFEDGYIDEDFSNFLSSDENERTSFIASLDQGIELENFV